MRRSLLGSGLTLAVSAALALGVSLVWLVEWHSPKGPFGGIYAGRINFGLAPPYSKGWLVLRDPGKFNWWFGRYAGEGWWIVAIPLWAPMLAGATLAVATWRTERDEAAANQEPIARELAA